MYVNQNECYSYIKSNCGKNCHETMKTHIITGLKIIEQYISKRHSLYISRELENINLSVDSETIDDLLKLAFIMHDIGKGLNTYQEIGSYAGHEYISGYLLYNSQITIKRTSINNTIKGIIALAITLHHHTLLGRFEKIKDGQIIQPCINTIKKILPKNISIKMPNTVKSQYVKRTIADMRENILRKYYRIIYLFMTPIMIADNYAAQINRKGEGSTLGNEILSILEW